jgi:hypothetical protein
MRRLLLSAAIALVCVPMLNALPAHAQATRTWVSGVGDDANPCSRTAPCKTFAGAISKTAAGGIINCIDPGGFGAVTITRSITIDCTNTMAGVLAAGTNAISVNGAGVNVILRGLDIEGVGTGLIGINFIQGASLLVDRCNIYGFQSGTAQGVRFVPSAGGQLVVLDSVISYNGTGAAGGGVFIDPGAGGTLVTLERVQIVKNFEGFRATGTGGGIVRVSVKNSVSSINGTNGIVAHSPAGGAAVDIEIQNSAINHNGSNGILADGPTARIVIGNSMLAKNSNGFIQANSGVISSFVNNAVDSLGSNGAATPPAVPPL